MAMVENFEITSPQHWKALSHPLRLGILQSLTDGLKTNEQLASALGVESGKLYFHTKRLLDAGMIELAETRAKGPITEKYYRVVAQRFSAVDANHDPDRSSIESGLIAGLELYRQARRGSNGFRNETQFSVHFILPQSPERVVQFVERLKKLAAEFQDETTSQLGDKMVSLSALLYTFPVSENQSDPIPVETQTHEGE